MIYFMMEDNCIKNMIQGFHVHKKNPRVDVDIKKSILKKLKSTENLNKDSQQFDSNAKKEKTIDDI